MAICKSKYKNFGSEDDKLLYKTCTESPEHFHIYFRELRNHLLRYNKYEELYNYCCNSLTNIKNNPMSRITTLKLISITLIQKPKNINHLINKKIITYAYKLLKRDKEGVNKKYISYFGDIKSEERNLIVTESKHLFRIIKNITLIKNSKEQKFIKNIIKKIENKKIIIPEKFETSHSILLYDFDNCKKEIYELLENDHGNHHKIEYVYSNYIKLLDEVKKKTRDFLYNGEYQLYCDFIRETQDEEEVNIRYESYLLCLQDKTYKEREVKELSQDSILLEEEMNKKSKNISNLKSERLFSSSSSILTKKNIQDKKEFNPSTQDFSNNFEKFEINSYNKNVYYDGSVDKESEINKKNLKREGKDKKKGEMNYQVVINNDEENKKYQISEGEKKKEQEIYLEKDEKEEKKKKGKKKEKLQNINFKHEEKEKKSELEIYLTEEGEKKKEDEINLEEKEQNFLTYNEKFDIREIKKNTNEETDVKDGTITKHSSNKNVEYNEEYTVLENNYYKEKEKINFFNENKIILDFINKIYVNDKKEYKIYQPDNINCCNYKKYVRNNKERDTFYSDSFDTAENEIINEFNSMLNEEKRENSVVNSYKNIEFKNTINRNDSFIWNNLIKKSNFYRIKEDFLNYNKFLKEKEKETKIKTLGDLLGMNKYIKLKKNTNKYKSKKTNPDELNSLIKKYTKHINVKTMLGNHKAPETLFNEKKMEITVEGNKEKNIESDKKKTELKKENVSLTSFNKYFTLYDNIKNMQKTILKDNSLLYNDDNIEISLEQYYFGNGGLIKLYLKNKKLVNFYDIDIQFSNKILFPLKFKFLNYEKTLCYNATNCYEIAVKCLHIYKGFPLIKISFRMQDMFKKSIDLRLPISINKFMKKMKITKEVFNKFWNNEKFNLYKKEKIIFKRDIVDKEFIFKNSCLGDALSVCYSEDRIYFFGCYSENSDIMENYFVLVAVEIKKKKLKITCKSNNPTLSSAILFLMILLYKNHEKK
ncbi:conserved Plasmodium protein, unknown function [Plasmodium relictum]|uniref:Clathrin adaptor domain-containing protein n=1 Tax=Plasmodium relictum TaxID=85471 RepID=A0A1J1HC48_PLARL|nr:conserved Plasmodium protein, unknown function [Plasmodium relictum]CRH02879.1 conserved Plasmodium protein, unknown function [Plasmodium relictum]